LKASISSFRRWVHENLPDEADRSKVTVLRDDVEPGSEAQIDYGFLGQWINPGTGKRHRIWAFVMVLPCSRHMFVRPVIPMDQHAWTESHAEAFRFFGGVPRRLVPDNLRTGVDKPDLYDPKINKAYAELALYYGALVDPARAVHPKDKPRVERPMPYVRDSFWSGRQFTSLEHMQAEALVWAREITGGRQCRPLGGAAPLAVFDAVEAPALLPLPDKPFVLARSSTATVGPDTHDKVGRTLYSVPWKLIGRRVDVRSTATMVQVFHKGQSVKTHAALEQGKRTDRGDYPPEKIAFGLASLGNGYESNTMKPSWPFLPGSLFRTTRTPFPGGMSIASVERSTHEKHSQPVPGHRDPLDRRTPPEPAGIGGACQSASITPPARDRPLQGTAGRVHDVPDPALHRRCHTTAERVPAGPLRASWRARCSGSR
jgi:transposase